MSRRKSSAPARLVNNQENWTWHSENINLHIPANEDETPNKKRKFNTFTSSATKYNKNNAQFLLGNVIVGSTNNALPNNWNKCKIQIDDENATFHFDNDLHVCVKVYDSQFIKEIVQSQIFSFEFNVDKESSLFHMSLYLRQIPLYKFNNKIGQLMKSIMADFFSIDSSDVFESSDNKLHENVDDLYEGVKFFRRIEELNKNVQHAHLLPELRPYQADAVRWMIRREQVLELEESLHPMYMKIILKSGVEIYYNKYTGYVETTRPVVNCSQTGGILADEMGLGKTVEVLACILNNQRTRPSESNSAPVTNNNADETIPTIETQAKYVNPNTIVRKPINEVEITATDQLLRNKSPAKIAAQIWYNNKLAEMEIKKPVRKTRNMDDKVQCICGDFTRKGLVRCCDCKKLQHAQCMGFNRNVEEYCCPQCWTNKPIIKSRATLIVAPVSIFKQWSMEVQQHIRQNGLKVFEYNGIHKAGMVYPTDLADYDLVITTYNVLQSELKFATEQQGSFTLRHAKRYNIPTTPLLYVEWWRLCLDEAQTVDCPARQVSCMARQLNAVHRWAVTGTPIQKNIKDLYGLLEYLLLKPFNDIDAWNYILYYPYVNGSKEALFKFFSQIMWRSSKIDVIDQINVPPQTVEEHWLHFSAVEKFFYKREHELFARDLLTKLNQYQSLETTLCSIDRHTLNIILTPLLSLRQACIHPHAVRGRYLTSKRQVNSMEELLEALIKKNNKECDESLRAVLAALNGMAGVLLLQEKSLEAVEKYREALLYMSEYDTKEFIKIDKLQRIHTLYNLNEILTDNSLPKPAPTLRDDRLKEEYEVVECKYMEKYISEACAAFKDAELATKCVQEMSEKLILKEGEWCAELLDCFVENSLEDEFLKRIQTVSSSDLNGKLKYNQIASVKSILYLITIWMDKIPKHIKKLRTLFDEFENAVSKSDTLKYRIDDRIVDHAMDCHLRPIKTKKVEHPCLCCALDTHLKKYECVLFQMDRKINKESESNKGNWHPAAEEKLLKVIYSFAKSKHIDIDLLLKDAETHIALCELRRKEFKELRKLYTFYDQQVSAQDELSICKIRFRLRNIDEPVKIIQKKKAALRNLDYELENKYEFIHMLDLYELDYNINLLNEEKIINEQKLKKLIGTHSYLEILRKQQYDGQSPDPCPICSSQLTESWSILQCGHCYCLDCIHKLLEWCTLRKSVICSVCRKPNLYDDISYIKMNNNDNTVDEIEIKGSHSTKIQAILQCVLKLQAADPDVKVLIFSTWQTVLKLLSAAFITNSITHELLSSYNIHKNLKRFKDKEKNVTALLLPLRLGGKGLNLTEATHVILVEPLMNPGDELQAIGRVHRIGQTKPTVVHRFLIKNTIEESIHNAVAADIKQWDKNKLSLLQLKNLFSDTTTDTEEN